jgi:hypothetical protein
MSHRALLFILKTTDAQKREHFFRAEERSEGIPVSSHVFSALYGHTA